MLGWRGGHRRTMVGWGVGIDGDAGALAGPALVGLVGLVGWVGGSVGILGVGRCGRSGRPLVAEICCAISLELVGWLRHLCRRDRLDQLLDLDGLDELRRLEEFGE